MNFIEIVLLAGLLSFFYAYIMERQKARMFQEHLYNLMEVLSDIADEKAICVRTPQGHVNVEKIS